MKTRYLFFVGVLLVLGLVCVPARSEAKPDKKKADMPIFADKRGQLRKKVIIKTDEARLHTLIGDKGERRYPFEIFYRFYDKDGNEVTEQGGVKYYRVGTGADKILGFLKVDDCIEWNTRFMLKPTANALRRFKIFVKKDKKDADPKSARDLENMVVGAELATPGGLYQDDAAFILQTAAQDRAPAYRVAFYIGGPRTSADRVAAPKNPLRELKLEIVFVIDTTGSMTDLLEGTKEVAAQVADVVAKRPKLKGRVRLGLVEYQDATVAPTGKLIPARLVKALTDDLAEFHKALKPLKVATLDSEEWEEDVLAGLKMAIDKGGWQETSSKHIILLGDAGAHLGGVKNREGKDKNTTGMSLESIITHGRKPRGGGKFNEKVQAINFHAVLARIDVKPNYPDRVKAYLKKAQETARKHFTHIAGNNGSFKGAYQEVDANNKESRDKAVAEIVKTITTAFDALEEVSSGKVLEVGGPVVVKDKVLVGSQGAIKRAVYELALVLQPKKGDRFAEGWAAERAAGFRVAEPYVMVDKQEIRSLQVTLNYIHTLMEGKTSVAARKNNKNLLQALRLVATSAGVGQTVEIKEDTKLEEFITDLPLKTDVLRITPAKLADMTAEDFKAWLNKLKGAGKALQTMYETNPWNRSGADTAGKKSDDEDFVEYKFVRLVDLP
jgi:hypothetical protein